MVDSYGPNETSSMREFLKINHAVSDKSDYCLRKPYDLDHGNRTFSMQNKLLNKYKSSNNSNVEKECEVSSFSSNFPAKEHKIFEITQKLSKISDFLEGFSPTYAYFLRETTKNILETFEERGSVMLRNSLKKSEIKSLVSHKDCKNVEILCEDSVLEAEKLKEKTREYEEKCSFQENELEKLKEELKKGEFAKGVILKENEDLKLQIREKQQENESIFNEYKELQEIVEKLREKYNFVPKIKKFSENFDDNIAMLYCDEKLKVYELEQKLIQKDNEIKELQKTKSTKFIETEHMKTSKNSISRVENAIVQNLLGNNSVGSSEEESEENEGQLPQCRGEGDEHQTKEERHNDIIGKLYGETEFDPSLMETKKGKRKKKKPIKHENDEDEDNLPQCREGDEDDQSDRQTKEERHKDIIGKLYGETEFDPSLMETKKGKRKKKKPIKHEEEDEDNLPQCRGGEDDEQSDHQTKEERQKDIVGKLYGETEFDPSLMETKKGKKKKKTGKKQIKHEENEKKEEELPHCRGDSDNNAENQANEEREAIIGKLVIGAIEFDPSLMETEKGKRKKKKGINKKKDENEKNNEDLLSEEEQIKIGKLLGDIEYNPELDSKKKEKREPHKIQQEIDHPFTKIGKYLSSSDLSSPERTNKNKNDPSFNQNNNIKEKKMLRTFKDKIKQTIGELLRNTSKITEINEILLTRFVGSIPVSPLNTISEFAKDYSNEKIKEKIDEIKEKIPVYRAIKGDGNCYFRAVGFKHLENLVLEPIEINSLQNLKIKTFIDVFKDKTVDFIDLHPENLQNLISKEEFSAWNSVISDYFVQILLEILIMKLNFWEENDSTPKEQNILITKYLENKISSDLAFDLAMIWAMRSLLWFQYKYKREDPRFTPYYLDFDDEKNTIFTYGKEAEKILIALLADSLGCQVKIHILHVDYQKKEENAIILEEIYGKDDGELAIVELFFRPGHYDIGYGKEFLIQAYGKLEI